MDDNGDSIITDEDGEAVDVEVIADFGPGLPLGETATLPDGKQVVTLRVQSINLLNKPKCDLACDLHGDWFYLECLISCTLSHEFYHDRGTGGDHSTGTPTPTVMNKSQQESGTSLTTLTLAVLAVGVVTASISWFVAGRSCQRTPHEQGHAAASFPEFVRAPTYGEPIGENIVDGVIAFGSRDLLQTIQIYESSDGQGGQERKNLIVERTEVDPSTGERVRTTRRYVTSLEIVDVAARFHNDILVVLRKESTLYVERWLLFDEPGAWTATLDMTPQGGPVVTPDSTTFIQGGAWIHPSERAGTLVPERRAQLQSMPWDGSYRGISIDPDGRYFIIAEGRELYQFPMVGGSAGTLVSSPTMGVNFDALMSIYPADAAGYGRVFICRFDAALVGRLDDFALIDNENDGVFDTHSTAVRTGEIGDLGDIQGNITRLFYTGD